MARMWSQSQRMGRYFCNNICMCAQVVISPNGQDVITISEDGAAQVWDMNVGDCVMQVRSSEPDDAIMDIRMPPHLSRHCQSGVGVLPNGLPSRQGILALSRHMALSKHMTHLPAEPLKCCQINTHRV
eukprot:scaffold6897_cov20-Tisochrysis_lutea.AAC.2